MRNISILEERTQNSTLDPSTLGIITRAKIIGSMKSITEFSADFPEPRTIPECHEARLVPGRRAPSDCSLVLEPANEGREIKVTNLCECMLTLEASGETIELSGPGRAELIFSRGAWVLVSGGKRK
jgi:hypothetical protein